jgi:hypothetical protein
LSKTNRLPAILFQNPYISCTIDKFKNKNILFFQSKMEETQQEEQETQEESAPAEIEEETGTEESAQEDSEEATEETQETE